MQVNLISRGLLFAVMLVPAFASAQIINTVAGNGIPGSAGDGGPATTAQLNSPYDVVADTNGNIYILDFGNSKIRKVATDGTISLIAGGAFPGFGGDNGLATGALLSFPRGIAIDRAGNLYFSDGLSVGRVRKITTDGVITTIAGNGSTTPLGDGGPAIAAGLRAVHGVAVDDAGNVYLTEPDASRVRKVDTNGIITTVAGTGVAGFSGDGGLASAARLNFPRSVAVNAQGEVLIADSSNNRIRKVDAAGSISTIAGNGVAAFSGDGGDALNARMSLPGDIDTDASGNLYVYDVLNRRIRRIDPSGVIATVAGSGVVGFSGDGEPAMQARMNGYGIDIDHLGSLYIADLANMRVRKVSAPDATGPEIVPIVEGLQGNNGWYLGQVSVGWDVYDLQSPVTSRSGCDITTLPNDSSDVTLTCTATSAGGTSTASTTIRIDSTAPTLNPTIVPSPVIVNQSATGIANATDALSGVASQTCAPVNTASIGMKSVACIAQDVAGNQQSATASYSVFYGFNGFLSPLVEAPGTNRIKKGRTLPVRWSMLDGQGSPILNLASAQAQFVAAAACDGTFQGVVVYPPNTYVVGQGHNDESALQNLGGGVYQLNWLVPTQPRDVCGQLRVRFADGMDYTLNLWIE